MIFDRFVSHDYYVFLKAVTYYSSGTIFYLWPIISNGSETNQNNYDQNTPSYKKCGLPRTYYTRSNQTNHTTGNGANNSRQTNEAKTIQLRDFLANTNSLVINQTNRHTITITKVV